MSDYWIFRWYTNITWMWIQCIKIYLTTWTKKVVGTYICPFEKLSNLGANRFFLVWGSAWNEQHFSTKAEEAQRKKILAKWRKQVGKSLIENRRVLCYNTMLILSVDYLDRLFYDNCTFCGIFVWGFSVSVFDGCCLLFSPPFYVIFILKSANGLPELVMFFCIL